MLYQCWTFKAINHLVVHIAHVQQFGMLGSHPIISLETRRITVVSTAIVIASTTVKVGNSKGDMAHNDREKIVIFQNEDQAEARVK